MPEFLHLMVPEEARKHYFSFFTNKHTHFEKIQSEEAYDRVFAENIFASDDLPGFTRSTVDGYAVRSKDSYGASESLPAFFQVIGEVKMGNKADQVIQQGEAVLIHTGGMLPKDADAVVMLENTQITIPGEIEVSKAVAPNENIIAAGEDVKTGSLIFQRGTKIRTGDIGALMSLGIMEINVFPKLKVGIISSGDEIVEPKYTLQPGQVRDINSYLLSALVQKHGAIPTRYGIVADDKELLRKAVEKAHRENDLVIVTAGSSASVRDFTAEVIQSIGDPGVLVHGVNVRPGKPTILALCDQKPIIGLPGNPVSAYVVANIFVVPLIKKLNGEANFLDQQIKKGILTVNLNSVSGREDWVPVKINETANSQLISIEPVFYKSNLIFSIIRADGFVRIPPDVTGYSTGAEVEVIFV